MAAKILGVLNAQYGAAYTIYFGLEVVAGTNSDRLITAAVAAIPVVAGDVKISKDGGALADTTNLPTQITASQPLYALTLTATEMQASRIVVNFVDQTATPTFRDLMILIETVTTLGRFYVDASLMPGNVNGIDGRGAGSGHGISGTAGASGKVSNLFDSVLGTEPSAAFAVATVTAAQALQLIGMRLFHKVSADSTSLTMYKADDSTVLGTAAPITVASGVVTRGRFT